MYLALTGQVSSPTGPPGEALLYITQFGFISNLKNAQLLSLQIILLGSVHSHLLELLSN